MRLSRFHIILKNRYSESPYGIVWASVWCEDLDAAKGKAREMWKKHFPGKKKKLEICQLHDLDDWDSLELVFKHEN